MASVHELQKADTTEAAEGLLMRKPACRDCIFYDEGCCHWNPPVMFSPSDECAEWPEIADERQGFCGRGRFPLIALVANWPGEKFAGLVLTYEETAALIWIEVAATDRDGAELFPVLMWKLAELQTRQGQG
ncbi:MAG: hypothetical protein ACOYXY_21945 [Thermodesulfobacteriota bacterium]